MVGQGPGRRRCPSAHARPEGQVPWRPAQPALAIAGRPGAALPVEDHGATVGVVMAPDIAAMVARGTPVSRRTWAALLAAGRRRPRGTPERPVPVQWLAQLHIDMGVIGFDFGCRPGRSEPWSPDAT